MADPNIPNLTSTQQIQWAESMMVAAYRSGITDPKELANFMGQVQHESLNFTRLEENLNYSGSRLYDVFPGRNGLTRDGAQAIANIADRTERHQAVAEQVYGGAWGARRLGNTDTEITLGAGKDYDAAEFIEALQEMRVVPHVAQNKSGRASAVPDEIAASEGYAISQEKRQLIEQGFGWGKFIGPIRQVMVRGLKKVGLLFTMTMTAYNLVRMRTLGQVRLHSRVRNERQLRGKGPSDAQNTPLDCTLRDRNRANRLKLVRNADRAASAGRISAAC